MDNPTEPSGNQHHIHLHGPTYGLSIGDYNRVAQQFGPPATPTLDESAYAQARTRYLDGLRAIQPHPDRRLRRPGPG